MLQKALILLGLVILAASLLHIVLGPNADVILGARLNEAVLADPTLDSQNRFYGAAFALYGLLLIYCSFDVDRHKVILYIVISTFLFAGVVRFISVVVTGWPSIFVVALIVAEIAIPPFLLLWIRSYTHRQSVDA